MGVIRRVSEMVASLARLWQVKNCVIRVDPASSDAKQEIPIRTALMRVALFSPLASGEHGRRARVSIHFAQMLGVADD